MDNLNTVPSNGTFGQAVNVINQNFGKTELALNEAEENIANLQNMAYKDVGYFETVGDLEAAYPEPTEGMYAGVWNSTSNAYVIYQPDANGDWASTGHVDPRGLVLDNALDPTSDNPVKNKAVSNEIYLGGVYDVTAHNSGATFASLSALLSDANLSTYIPTAVRKGGMSIKFEHTSDNKYLQYRLVSDTFNTTPANWQGVDDEPALGSSNLTKGSGVINVLAINGRIKGNLAQGETLQVRLNEGDIVHLYFEAAVGKGLRFKRISGSAEEFTVQSGQTSREETYTLPGDLKEITAIYGNVSNIDIWIERYKALKGDENIQKELNKLSYEIKETSQTVSISAAYTPFALGKPLKKGQIVKSVSGDSSYINGRTTNNEQETIRLEAGVILSKDVNYVSLPTTASSVSIVVYDINENIYNINFTLKETKETADKMEGYEDIIRESLSIPVSVPFITQNKTYWKGNVGETISSDASSYNYRSDGYISVIEGEKYYADATPGGSAKLWLLTNDSNVIVAVGTTKEFTIPEGATRAYFNYNPSSSDFSLTRTGKIDKELKTLSNTVSAHSSSIETINTEIEDINTKTYMAAGKKQGGIVSLTSDDWEVGNIDGSTGKNIWSNSVIRTKGFVSVANLAKLVYSLDTTHYRFGFIWYDINKKCLGNLQWINQNGSRILNTTTEAKINYIRLIIAYSDGTSGAPSFNNTNFSLYIDADLDIRMAKANPNIELPIYCPSPQLPANGSAGSDFNAETLTPAQLYEAYDNLLEEMPVPYGGNGRANPKYGTLDSVTSLDASGDYELRTYVFTARNRYAWKASDRLYAWNNNGSRIYTKSCSPRIGDTVYNSSGSDTGNTITSFNSTTMSVVVSDTTYTRDFINNIDADVLFSKQCLNNNASSGTLALYNSQDTSVGDANVVNSTTVTINSKTYTRYASFDYHTKTKGTIFLWANEHAPQSDPNECAIICYRFAKDLCHNANNAFIQFIKNYCKVVIIPVGNPYGMAKWASDHRDGRTNYNNVNLNRNYCTPGWAEQSDTNKGNYAGDQNETQYIMNQCLKFNSNVAIDFHCLGYVGESAYGQWAYGSANIRQDYITRLVDMMRNSYGLDGMNYGNADYNVGAEGNSFLAYNNISGGLIEMNAGAYATSYDGKQHTSFIMEADYTLLLNAIRMYYASYDGSFTLSDMYNN